MCKLQKCIDLAPPRQTTVLTPLQQPCYPLPSRRIAMLPPRQSEFAGRRCASMHTFNSFFLSVAWEKLLSCLKESGWDRTHSQIHVVIVVLGDVGL